MTIDENIDDDEEENASIIIMINIINIVTKNR
eukprot:CAMPEP_0171013742 /NCGR_PEP_ID=MMETSP0736-20130129/24573_1 /TAXON_ID=186038 /ORGANISM="Fragilariopsis kerguelensis, Strain L26-C5" /LENGTH=31 /DNA_ID= /DNA_START= /DNA_END= /DNA_ORIENTATION=